MLGVGRIFRERKMGLGFGVNEFVKGGGKMVNLLKTKAKGMKK